MAALGKDAIDDIGGKIVIFTQMLLLSALILDEYLDCEALDLFIETILPTAEEWSN